MSSSGQRNKWQGLVRRLPDGKDAVYAGWTLELIATLGGRRGFCVERGLNAVALVLKRPSGLLEPKDVPLAYEQRLLSKSGR
jgi:hypothetical protein